MHSLRMHRAWNFSLVLLFIGFNLIACDGPRGVVTALNTETPAAPVNSPGTYRLSPGDKLKVTVFNEVDLTGEFQVNERGNIAFRLLAKCRLRTRRRTSSNSVLPRVCAENT